MRRRSRPPVTGSLPLLTCSTRAQRKSGERGGRRGGKVPPGAGRSAAGRWPPPPEKEEAGGRRLTSAAAGGSVCWIWGSLGKDECCVVYFRRGTEKNCVGEESSPGVDRDERGFPNIAQCRAFTLDFGSDPVLADGLGV